MKTLFISGTIKKQKGSHLFTYDICLIGQTEENPKMQVVTYLLLKDSNYHKMMQECRNSYTRYFNVDEFNIIHLEHLTPLF